MKTCLAMAAVVWLAAASCEPERFKRGLEDIGVDTGTGGGEGCVPSFAGDLLYTFDTSAGVFTGPAPDPAGTLPSGWLAYPEPTASAALEDSSSGWSGSEGHACPGALVMNANFTVYGSLEKVMGLINFAANWKTPKAYLRLHAWVKIPAPSSGNIDHLDGLQLSASTNNYKAFLGNTVPATAWVDGDWHEIVLELVPAMNYLPEDIRQVGVQLIAKPAAIGNAPAEPVPTTFLVDDIWLEPPGP